ncbi:MAG: hypothetical protein RLZZ450_6556 [Pseudomonadota bacterium]|jgi:MYXO-CTERM domain-containing protein
MTFPRKSASALRALHHATLACGLLWALAPHSVARAHVCMDAPASRVGAGCSLASAQKQGPCGVAQRGTKPTEFRPGETITVSLNETVDHLSHYRIAFNPDGDAFEDPTSKDDKTGAHPFVLLDNITDESAAKQSVRVTLPNVTCERCTLQLIQVMYDKGGNGFGGNDGVAPDNDDLYYACADIVLKGEPATGAPAVGDAGSSPSDAGLVPRDAGATPTDAGTPAVKRDAAVATPDPEEDPPAVERDAGKRKDAAVPVDESDDDADDGDTAAKSKSDEGCSLASGGASSGGWLALAMTLVAHRRRRNRLRAG